MKWLEIHEVKCLNANVLMEGMTWVQDFRFLSVLEAFEGNAGLSYCLSSRVYYL